MQIISYDCMQDMSWLVIRHVGLKIMGGQVFCTQSTQELPKLLKPGVELCVSRFEHPVLIEKRKKA